MSNSIHTNQDNIIPFKQRDKSQTASLQKPKCELTQKYVQQTTSATKPSQRHHDDYAELLVSKGNPTQELVNAFAPSLVRRIIRHVRMQNKPNKTSPKTLTKNLRRQLQLLIDFNHPAGLVLKEWLDGHRQLLPYGFEETYARISNREEAGHE